MSNFVNVDGRQAEADRHFSAWVQKGVPPKVVKELLGMLVGPLRTQQAAERWLSQNAIVGNDMSPEGEAQDRQLISRAKALHQSALNSGAFAGHGDVFQPGVRYTPSDSQIEATLDEQAAPLKYPGAEGNARRLRLADAEEKMQRKHRDSTATVEDNGDVFVTDPHTLTRRKVDHVALPPRKRPVSVEHLQRGQYDTTMNLSNAEPTSAYDGVVHYSEPDDDAAWDTGANKPYWVD